ncbi:PAS domain S-box protein [Hydrogenophaga sp.]|uniref:PAS domain S-box protein n=1 Tax=Hydrogenophaga sp. TaxID=1904254 RepID=UPI0026124558|nr:PAS domain S-box protein [Hydrogenophaga sp.]MDM7950305.1 PAS domain S-box protein [Hydrogenophaga sp.]
MNPTQPSARHADESLWSRLLDWQPEQRSLWRRLVVAVVLTLLAAWLRVELAPAESGGRYVTLSMAVAFSAIYGGVPAGLLSTVLSLVLVNFLLIPPLFSFAIDDPVEAFWLNLWFLIGQVVVVGAIGWMQRQNLRLRQVGKLAASSQQRFLDTFEFAAAGMSHVSLEGQMLRVNKTFCQLVGYSEAELLRMRFRDFTVADDVAPDEALLARTLAGEIDRYSLEKRYIHKDGHLVWAHLTVALVRGPGGVPDYFISVVQDLSALKKAETALRTSERLMRQAQTLAGFASFEANVKENHFRTLGNSHHRLGLPRAEFSGDDLLAVAHPADRERMTADWLDALRGIRPYNITYRTRITGQERWFSVRAEFERDAEGRAIRAFGVSQDITERKRSELEIRRLNASLEYRIQERTRELKDAYDELESYSYAVAHDLRSPLRIINGFAQALEEDSEALTPSSRAHLDRIRGASLKMGQLIDGLLELAQYGRGEMQRKPVDLGALARHMLEEWSSAEPGRSVTWDIEPGLLVQADPALMDALMQNLLHNAWKYSALRKDAHIRVFARVADGQTHYCVSDNGAGFDMARASKLFQPFHRLHLPHEFSGLGIGLATVRRIVLRHGGTLKAESAPDAGATFCFTIPDEPNSTPPSGH